MGLVWGLDGFDHLQKGIKWVVWLCLEVGLWVWRGSAGVRWVCSLVLADSSLNSLHYYSGL